MVMIMVLVDWLHFQCIKIINLAIDETLSIKKEIAINFIRLSL